MQPFTVGDLQELLGERKGPCVSVFLPTHRRPDGANEDRLRFRSLVEKARKKLEAVVAPRAVPRLAASLERFADGAFWRDSLDGLAVFSAPQFTRHWRIPMEMPERVVVANTFHVRPLIRYLQSDRRWYVLSLSGGGAAFFEGTPAGLVAKVVPGIPRTPAEADVTPHEKPGLSSHSAGGRRAVFHGAGGVERTEREDTARWLRAVDDAVSRLLRDEHAPLVVAAVAKLQAAYRTVSRYPHLAGGVEGNFGRAKPEALHARAAPVAAAAFAAREDEAVSEYQRLNGAMRSSDDVEVVAAAAVAGRVRRLVIARGRTVRGTFDRATGAVGRRAAREDAYGDDVLDDLAEAVLVRGGAVLFVEKERMPTKSPVAAVLRW
jgi:hypothetical protein